MNEKKNSSKREEIISQPWITWEKDTNTDVGFLGSFFFLRFFFFYFEVNIYLKILLRLFSVLIEARKRYSDIPLSGCCSIHI